MQFEHFRFLSILGAFAVACGSSAHSATNTNTQPAFNVAGNGSGQQVVYDGGVSALTPEQVTAIESSACAGWSREGESLPALLDFVVDVSGSMGLTSATTGNRTKWDITQAALGVALETLPGATAVGMIFFPNQSTRSNTSGNVLNVSQCVNTNAMIPIATLGAAGSAQRQALAAGLAAAQPAGGTPTDDAYEFELVTNMNSCALPGRRFMVLITDGQPTFSKGCIGTGNTSDPVDYTPVIDAIARAWNNNGPSSAVKTFIIGSPGSEAQASTGTDGRGWLSQAAQVGQTPQSSDCSNAGPNYCHFDMSQVPDFAVGFSNALAQISGQIVSCSYAIPPPPAGQTLDLTKINVIFTHGTGEQSLLLRSTSDACATGWFLDTNNNVVLCGESCNQAKADGASSLKLLFGCGSIGIPLT